MARRHPGLPRDLGHHDRGRQLLGVQARPSLAALVETLPALASLRAITRGA